VQYDVKIDLLFRKSGNAEDSEWDASNI
jgi:hypothetical protein